MADVVLPVTQWAEETGTMTNLEGRVILRQQAAAPPAGVRSDLEVIAALAERVGSPVPFSTDPESVFLELGRASAGGRADYAGITYDRIRAEHGVFWPCPTPQHPGTPRLFADSFFHADGRARFVDVEHRGPAEPVDAAYPVHLTTGRVLAQYQSGAQTRRVADLPDTGPFVELHPMLASRIGARDGEPVVVATRRGELKAPARVVTTIRPDTVFVPFHWVGANRLTNDALDPSSRMPEFKVCAARVTPVVEVRGAPATSLETTAAKAPAPPPADRACRDHRSRPAEATTAGTSPPTLRTSRQARPAEAPVPATAHRGAP
jgi:assimilatory nitrate reductase catalytic subunit